MRPRRRAHLVLDALAVTLIAVPPPEGGVTRRFFTQRGAVMLMIDGVDEGHTADNQPLAGWGC